MAVQRKNQSGQMILAEHVLILFVVITTVVAMMVYFQRALQARIFDARNFAVSKVKDECDGDCLKATGGDISREYEPYYGNIVADTQRSTKDLTTIEGGVSAKEGIYRKVTDESTDVKSVSRMMPPKDAQ